MIKFPSEISSNCPVAAVARARTQYDCPSGRLPGIVQANEALPQRSTGTWLAPGMADQRKPSGRAILERNGRRCSAQWSGSKDFNRGNLGLQTTRHIEKFERNALALGSSHIGERLRDSFEPGAGSSQNVVVGQYGRAIQFDVEAPSTNRRGDAFDKVQAQGIASVWYGNSSRIVVPKFTPLPK